MALVDAGKDWRQMILKSHAAINEPALARALIDAASQGDVARLDVKNTVGEVSSDVAQVSGCGQALDPSSPTDLTE